MDVNIHTTKIIEVFAPHNVRGGAVPSPTSLREGKGFFSEAAMVPQRLFFAANVCPISPNTSIGNIDTHHNNCITATIDPIDNDGFL